MSGDFHGVPVPLVLALWTAIVGAMGWLGKGLWHWLRLGSSRDWDENLRLRGLLDRLRRRENAYATGCELLLIVMPPELTRAQRLAVERTRQLLETAIIPLDEGE